MNSSNSVLLAVLSLLLGLFVGIYLNVYSSDNDGVPEASQRGILPNECPKLDPTPPTTTTTPTTTTGPTTISTISTTTSKSEIPPKEDELFEQKCYNQNKTIDWEEFKSRILKDNSIYDQAENFTAELDLHGWTRIELAIGKLLEDVIKTVKNNSILIVEIGSWKGKSTSEFAKACQNITQTYNYSCQVIAADTWLGSSEHYESPIMLDYLDNLFFKFLNNMKLQNLNDVVYPFRIPSTIAAHVFHCFGLEADIIYIDANHDYKPVLRDIQLFYPLVRKDGILFGDDWSWAGVEKAVRQFLSTKDGLIKFWNDWNTWYMRKIIEEASFFRKMHV